jgi:trk system potassium uptake protein TrkA
VRRFAVIGLGRFGSTLACELASMGVEVLALDRKPELVAAVADRVALAVCADATDERALRDNGLDAVETAIVSMGESFESTQLAVVLLKRLGVGRVLAKSSVPVRIDILKRIGADEVISPEREGAERLAQKLLAPGVVEFLSRVGGRSLVQVRAPAKWVGRTIGDLDVRRRYRVNIVAIRRAAGSDAEVVHDLPVPTDVIEVDDVLVLIGGEEEVQKLAK